MKRDGVTRVCYVEDSPGVRARVLMELARIGDIEVVGWSECSRGAISLIRQLRPDLVVLDVQLAEGSGVDVLRACGGEGAPVMMMLSNRSDSFSRELCLRAGARHFFDKSTEFEEFLAVVRVFCAARRAVMV